ncbi:DNA topoisomerase VI subunit B, partial [Candidatus Undinarchaeota archaeon]
MGTADEQSAQMKEIAISEFFEKNRHLLGFDNPQKALITVVKEAVDNSLDACEEAKVLPDIKVDIEQIREDRFKVIVEDNGPGIKKDHITRVFGQLLYGSKFHRLKQSRGQQGIGISASVLYSQLTTGKKTKVYSKTEKDKDTHYYEIIIDTKKNRPAIGKEEIVKTGINHGTKIEMEMTGKYVKTHHSPYEFLRQVAIMNPYAEINYKEPDGTKILYKRAVHSLPKMPKEIKPHPHGIELGILMRMLRDTKARNLKSFMMTEFSRMGATSVRKICQEAQVEARVQPKKLNRDESERLLHAMQSAHLMSPPTDCLSPITKGGIEAGLKKEIEAEFVTAVTRAPAVYRGYPFQIEAGIAWGGEFDKVESEEEKASTEAKVMRYANKVPLLYQKSACAVSKAVAETNWKRYGLNQSGGRGVPKGPLVIAVHMASVWVPFTSESKEAIANYPEIMDEMKLALQECGRQLGAHLKSKYKARNKIAKRSTIDLYGKEVAKALAEITGKSEKNILKDINTLAEKRLGNLEDLQAKAAPKKMEKEKGPGHTVEEQREIDESNQALMELIPGSKENVERDNEDIIEEEPSDGMSMKAETKKPAS